MEITKMLTLSTVHISKETAEMLDCIEGRYDVPLIVFNKDDCGWFIHVSDGFEEENMSHDLKKCLLFAKDLGCKWLCLDCDGEVLDYLEKFDW